MTRKERIKYADEIERIEGMTIEHFQNMSFTNLWRLTLEFMEPFVRLILTKAPTNKEQLTLWQSLKSKHDAAYKTFVAPGEDFTPEYFDDLEYDMECNRLITIEGSIAPGHPVKSKATSAGGKNDSNDKKSKEHEDLKAENISLRAEKEVLEKRVAEIEANHESMIVELLKPLFYNDEKNVKDFLAKIRGMKDTEITDVVTDKVKRNIISSKSYRRSLWRILHAAKLYESTESNYNTAINSRP